MTIPAEVLGLSDVEIESVTTDLRAIKITIRVSSTKDEILCRECNQPTNPHGRGRLLQLRHLPILGKETIVEIIPLRGRCRHCDGDPTTTQRLDGYDTNSKFTRPYEQHLLFELINSTVADRFHVRKLYGKGLIALRKSELKRLFNLSPKLQLAYQLSHELTAVFNSHLTPSEAKALFAEWIDRVSASKDSTRL